MKAIIQLTIGVEVESEEQAASIAMGMDDKSRQAVLAEWEQRGIAAAEAEGLVEWYGTTVLMPRVLA